MAAAAASVTPATSKPKILIAYYSTYGHIQQLAEAESKGATDAGAEVKIVQIPETLSDEVLGKMHAPPKAKYPVATLDDLTWADGILFGLPTRYGNPAGQFKAFWDQTGGLWQKGALVGKPVGIFFSTGTQNGGQETTALTSFPNFVHHGMIVVPLGYQTPLLFNIDEVHGGGPYGAGTLAGPTGARQPSKLEIEVATIQGGSFTATAHALKVGREALAKK